MITAFDSKNAAGLVHEILETYDLSPGIKRAIALRVADTTEGYTFDEIYREIALLADRFSVPFNERFAVRLDSSLFGDRRTLHEVISIEEERPQYGEGISAANVISILDGKLDEKYLGLIRQMTSGTGKDEFLEFHVSRDEIEGNIPLIKTYLDDIISRYYRNGTLALANRDIADIETAGHLNIRYGRTNNSKLPEPTSPSSKEVLEEIEKMVAGQIKAAYFTYNGNVKEAAKALHFKGDTIRRYWIRAGHIPASRKLAEGQIEEIIEAYEQYGPFSAQAARHLPYSRQTIKKYWINAGQHVDNRRTPTNTRPAHALAPNQIEEIIEAHQLYKSATEAERHLPYSTNTILRYWRGAGLEILPGRRAPKNNSDSQVA